ncbi:SRPBCC family protein [Taibaiella soli]|uniref:SRPBCC domain-containing protein n=1 Tax=Taibaiella soli TaxID=1649169 RepID=A0A2W2ATY1_9BACT|nr:SRPBCC domain-containing protein [Taibaiella soli]PZF71168.1 SRPBCC domain-containing protein [Taibaiella soli]
MKTQDFSVAITVDDAPEKVFNAINNVRGWWSQEINGNTDKLGETWRYHYKDVHAVTMKITEIVPDKRVVWNVLENHFNFTNDQTEWVNSNVIFDISEKDGKTEMRLTHQGLVPGQECYDICSNAWTGYITGSLRDLITKGQGAPNPKEN